MKSITIIIPAYNEEGNLKKLTSNLITILRTSSFIWKIIIVNDASTDKTQECAQSLEEEYQEVQLINNSTNKNLGGSYLRALQDVDTEYVSWIPGDGEIPPSIYNSLLPQVANEKILITYPENSFETRSFSRWLLSKIYRSSINIIFKLNVKYQNGTSIIETKYLKKEKLISTGFTINLEILLRSQSSKLEIVEIPFHLEKRMYGKANAITFKKLYILIITIFELIKRNYWGQG